MNQENRARNAHLLYVNGAFQARLDHYHLNGTPFSQDRHRIYHGPTCKKIIIHNIPRDFFICTNESPEGVFVSFLGYSLTCKRNYLYEF